LVATTKKPALAGWLWCFGGAREDRTPDLVIDCAALVTADGRLHPFGIKAPDVELLQDVAALVDAELDADGIDRPHAPDEVVVLIDEGDLRAPVIGSAGAPLRYVHELLGHNFTETTQIYTQLTIIDLNAHGRFHPREPPPVE